MRLKDITDALNNYYLIKFPKAKGFFIGKEYVEPAKVNIYKKYKIDIYYHIPGKNHLAITKEVIGKCGNNEEDAFRDKAYTSLLEEIFNNLNKLDNYEAI